MQIREVIAEGPFQNPFNPAVDPIPAEQQKARDIQKVLRGYYEGEINKKVAWRALRALDNTLTKEQIQKHLKSALTGNLAIIGEPGTKAGIWINVPGLGEVDLVSPATLSMLVPGLGPGGAALKAGAGAVSVATSKAALAGAGAVSVATSKAALAYARQYRKLFNPKVLRKMDKIRTAKLKKKIAQLEKEQKFAMRDVERVKSILGQATGFTSSPARQYAASLVIAGGYLTTDIIQWSRDPNATVRDLVNIVGDAAMFEAGIILSMPITRIISMAAKKPLQSLWNLIKNFYSKYRNAVKVAGALAGLGSTTAIAGSTDLKNQTIN